MDPVNPFDRLPVELVALREASRLTQQQLADRMGVTQPAVARLEAGSGDPKVSTLVRWASALGRQLDPRLVELRSSFGDARGPLVGTVYPDGTLLRLDPFAAAASDLCPLTLVSGRPGSGKTRLLSLVLTQVALGGGTVAVVGRDTGQAVAALGLPVRPWSGSGDGSPLEGVVELDLSARSLSPSEVHPIERSCAQEDAHRELEKDLSHLVSRLPDGALLLVEEAWVLQGEAASALERLLREARSRRIAVMLSAQAAGELSRWTPLAARVLALAAQGPADTAAALDLCGIAPTPARLAEVADLWEGTRGSAVLRDLDGRTTPVLLGGTTLRT